MVKQYVRVVVLIVITSLATFANANDTGKYKKARVYTVFFSVPADLSSKILSELENKCKGHQDWLEERYRCLGIEFVGKETINYGRKDEYKKNDLVLQNIENLKKDLDGLILFFGGGFCDKRYMLTGLPTLIVDCDPFPSPQIGFKNAVALAEGYGAKFITATYSTTPRVFSTTDLSAARLNNLAEKVKLFDVIRKMKNAKLLTIQDYDKINPLDQKQWAEVNAPINDYDLNYPKRLKQYLGTDITIARSKELNQEIGKVEDKEAEKIADMWINEAKEVRNVKHRDIVRASKLYIALRKLIKKYDADAITLASWHLAGHSNPEPKTNVMPPLAWMQLSKEHIPCSCESLIDILVTQMIATYITEGHAGFIGDVLNFWNGGKPFEPTGTPPQNVVIIGHCGAPITPHGNDRIPYTIKEHVIAEPGRISWAKLFGPNDTPTATTVDWPTGEVASIVKFDVYRKKVSVFTGTVLDGNALYKNFPNTLCRNKIVVKVDNPENCYILAGQFRDDNLGINWGCHQVAVYGDLRQKIRDFAALIGFEVIE